MSESARNDYREFLSEHGADDKIVRALSEIESDRADVQNDFVYLGRSSIEGTGLFSSEDIKAGDLIMGALISGMRTQAGRYANHSDKPNGFMSSIGNDLYLMASEDIKAGDEITTSYRETHSVASSLDPKEQQDIVRDEIKQLELTMLGMKDLQVDIPIVHHFAHGVYGREMRVPAGVTFTGKIHKTEHLNVLAQGTMVIKSTTGMDELVSAPYIFVAPANTKRAGHTITDCVFLNVHGTHETDLEKIEDEFITKDFLSLGGDV